MRHILTAVLLIIAVSAEANRQVTGFTGVPADKAGCSIGSVFTDYASMASGCLEVTYQDGPSSPTCGLQHIYEYRPAEYVPLNGWRFERWKYNLVDCANNLELELTNASASVASIPTELPITDCSSGYVLSGGQCITAIAHYCATSMGTDYTENTNGDGALPDYYCAATPDGSGVSGSCKMETTQGAEFATKNEWAAKARGTGQVCTSTEESTDNPPNNDYNPTTTPQYQTTTTTTAPITTTNPDGSTTTSQSTTETTQLVPQQTTTTTEDTTTTTYQDGTIVTKTTTTTTTTAADGTVTTTTDTSYTGYTPWTGVLTTSPAGTTATEIPPATTATGATNETTITQPDGTTTTTRTDTGPGAAGAESEDNPAECGAPGQPPCEINWGTAAGVPTDAQSVSEATNSMWDRVQNAPIVQALSNLTMSGTGSCPTATFSIFMQTFTMDAHCIIGDEISGLLAAAAIAAWALLGLLIIASA